MPVSKNSILWLRGGGLKDDKDFIDNDQKDNAGNNNGNNTKDVDLNVMVLPNTDTILLMLFIVIIHHQEDVMAEDILLMMLCPSPTAWPSPPNPTY
eukprot:4830718-Ditylum_brightwellii.AAC.1